MGKLTEILTLAHARAESMQLPYAGAVTPVEAHEILQLAPVARLVDVRSRAEQDWVGRVPGAIELEWAHYPGMVRNENFAAQLKHQVDPEGLVLFICRSGARSDAAARVAAGLGYSGVYNVLEGFEGDRNADGQRSKVGGWRFAGLPWTQS